MPNEMPLPMVEQAALGNYHTHSQKLVFVVDVDWVPPVIAPEVVEGLRIYASDGAVGERSPHQLRMDTGRHL
jgi:hypothetical protein